MDSSVPRENDAPHESEDAPHESEPNYLGLVDEMNLHLVANGARPGYLRYGELTGPAWIPPGVSTMELPKDAKVRSRLVAAGEPTEYYDRPTMLYYGSGADPADIAILAEHGWEESNADVDAALGRALGYLCPGECIARTGTSVSYVASVDGTRVHLYGEAIPKGTDDRVAAQKNKLQESLRTLYPEMVVHVERSWWPPAKKGPADASDR